MIQEFYINSSATLPVLRMELINDGRNDYNKFYEGIQDADIKFSMKDAETGILKIGNKDASVRLAETNGCVEKYIIEYKWDERDTRKPGIYKGWFEINFHGDLPEGLASDGVFWEGKLIVPIQEDLLIYVK